MSDVMNEPTTDPSVPAARREALLTAAFVDIADNLVRDYDVADMLHSLAVRCVEIFGVTWTGILLWDQHDELIAIASSSEDARTMDVLQLHTRAGPCWEAAHTGAPVRVPDLEAEADRWPTYVEEGLRLGVRSVDAVPLRLRDRTVGALNLFRDSKGGSTVQDLAAIQALADVASISLLQARNVRDAEDTADHLQIALDSRVAIEQAKGIVSTRLSVELEDAFELLRQYSRRQNIKLTRVCLLVVEGELAPTDLT